MENPVRDLFASLSRRHFLRQSAAAAMSALAASNARQLRASDEKIRPTADTLILLWMAGGMAQTETFDPKRFTPFQPGLPSSAVLSTFPASTPSWMTSRSPRAWSVSLRSWIAAPDPHAPRRRPRPHSPYAAPVSLAHRISTAAIRGRPAHGRGAFAHARAINPDMPAFVDIGQNLEIGGESDGVKAFHTAGFLGTEYGPFLIADPADAMASVRPPAHMTDGRFRARYERYRKLIEASPIARYGSDYQQECARALPREGAPAGNVRRGEGVRSSLEPKALYDTYNTGRFGLGCLLARRLTEAGARFIEVTSEYVPFRYWDTHENGHEQNHRHEAVH